MMTIWHILSADGRMRAIIKAEIFIFVFCLSCFSLNVKAAENKIALYGKAKYETGFTSFDYVNENAPFGAFSFT